MKRTKLIRASLLLAALILLLGLAGCDKKAQNAVASNSNGASTEQGEKAGAGAEHSGQDGSEVQAALFDTVDIEGNAFGDDNIENAKLIMINFWEPWCGPCVAELPELQELYEDYSEKGLLILGVFSSSDADEDIKKIIKDKGVAYPVIRCNEALAKYGTAYLPTTIFMNADGKLLSEKPFIGANSYDGWAKIIDSYLDD